MIILRDFIRSAEFDRLTPYQKIVQTCIRMQAAWQGAFENLNEFLTVAIEVEPDDIYQNVSFKANIGPEKEVLKVLTSPSQLVDLMLELISIYNYYKASPLACVVLPI